MRCPTMWFVRPAKAQTSLHIRSCSMTLTLLTGHHLEFLSLTRGCTGSSESTLVKIPHRWLSHVTAHLADVKSEIREHVSAIIASLGSHKSKTPQGLVGCLLLKLPLHKAQAKVIA